MVKKEKRRENYRERNEWGIRRALESESVEHVRNVRNRAAIQNIQNKCIRGRYQERQDQKYAG